MYTNYSFTVYVDYPPVFNVYITDWETRTEFLYKEFVNSSNCEDPDGGPINLILAKGPNWLSFEGSFLIGKPGANDTGIYLAEI